jgi:hypothetical protein
MSRRNWPPDGPSRRTISLLIWATLLLLALNLLHQAGVA